MAATVQRSDLIAFIRANGFEKIDGVGVTQFKRAIENGLKEASRYRQWSFLTDNVLLSVPVEYTTGTISVGHNSTTVTGSGTNFPNDTVGAFIQFNGENIWYEISVHTSGTELTIAEAYKSTEGTDLSGKSFTITYPIVDLPAKFRTNLRLVDVGRRNSRFLRDVSEQDMTTLSNWGGETGQPYSYAHTIRRNDPNQRSVRLYPAPNVIENYRMLYTRHAGWYSTNVPATAVFKTKATLDTDYVDWPDDMMDVLEASILNELAREISSPRAGQLGGEFYQKVNRAAGDDEDQGDIKILSSNGYRGIGQRVFLTGE